MQNKYEDASETFSAFISNYPADVRLPKVALWMAEAISSYGSEDMACKGFVSAKQSNPNPDNKFIARLKKISSNYDCDITTKSETEDRVARLVEEALDTTNAKSIPLGMPVINQLRSHLAVCWSPSPGAAGEDAIIVDVIVHLNSKAEVKYVGIVDTSSYRSSQPFRAAADAVMRALYECSPLPLPLDKYEIWKELQFEFNPRFFTGN